MKEKVFISSEHLVHNPAAAELYLLGRKGEADRLKIDLAKKMFERDGMVFCEIYAHWEMRLQGTTAELIPPKDSGLDPIVASNLNCAIAWIMARFH